ncbi:MAG: DUF1538 domain-containing protein [Nitrospinota bacterium]|nr:DUF1538 domain-containing protein [Nitrospinota bacterium]
MEELNYLEIIYDSTFITMMDILPIVVVFAFFQWGVIRKSLPHWKKMLAGMGMVVVGLAVFIVGLEECIFPLGTSMAQQLSNPEFLAGDSPALESLNDGKRLGAEFYFEVIAFGFLIGFSTTLAEPALIAVAMKAREISTGAISTWGLRLAVALGVGVGVALGSFRIIEGTPLHYYIITGYVVLMIQTYFAPKFIIPLAYDSGGVTTSTVTVPLLVALGLGLASNVPGSSPLLDGFGLIAFASLFPMISVLAYAMIQERFFSRVPDSAIK